MIGSDATFSGPFGARPVVYCDYVASGRSLSFIEDFVRAEVLPLYSNTHTTTTVTSMQVRRNAASLTESPYSIPYPFLAFSSIYLVFYFILYLPRSPLISTQFLQMGRFASNAG